jgi:hypothetical protein
MDPGTDTHIKKRRLGRDASFLFSFGFFTVKFFSVFRGAGQGPIALQHKKEPAIDIAGLCLPLKPQKEKLGISFDRCWIFTH